MLNNGAGFTHDSVLFLLSLLWILQIFLYLRTMFNLKALFMNTLGFMKGFLALGDLTDHDITDRVKYKERIVFATMRAMIPNWEPPVDWDGLTDSEKLIRLEKLEEVA